MPQMIIGIRLGLLPRGGNCGLRTLLQVHDQTFMQILPDW